jgi:hypothetical protein
MPAAQPCLDRAIEDLARRVLTSPPFHKPARIGGTAADTPLWCGPDAAAIIMMQPGRGSCGGCRHWAGSLLTQRAERAGTAWLDQR